MVNAANLIKFSLVVVSLASLCLHGVEEAYAQKTSAIEDAAIEGLTTAYEESIEQEDVGRLGRLHRNFSQKVSEQWSELFLFFNILDVSVTAERLNFIEERHATLDIVFEIRYKDTKNRKGAQRYAYTWTLEEVDGAWKINHYTTQ